MAQHLREKLMFAPGKKPIRPKEGTQQKGKLRAVLSSKKAAGSKK